MATSGGSSVPVARRCNDNDRSKSAVTPMPVVSGMEIMRQASFYSLRHPGEFCRCFRLACHRYKSPVRNTRPAKNIRIAIGAIKDDVVKSAEERRAAACRLG